MKTSKILGISLILAVLFSPACEFLKHHDHTSSPDCELDKPIWLWYGQSTDCADLNITFTGDIQDSRCPFTVTCVWEGRVDVQLMVNDELISLGLPDDEQLGQSKAIVGEYQIELLDVFPAPITASEIPAESYKVKLFVTGL